MDAEKENFVKSLVKGKIAEIIFEQMFRDSGKYTILHAGYEYTLPELAQYQHYAEVRAVIENIRNAPDFILISQDHKKVYLVEVKYQRERHPDKLRETAKKILETWNVSWLFVASPDGFFLEPCSRVADNGVMNKLYGYGNNESDIWIEPSIQDDYLKLLNRYELK